MWLFLVEVLKRTMLKKQIKMHKKTNKYSKIEMNSSRTICMKGSIYTRQKCYECGGTLKYIEGHGFLQCNIHPKMIWAGHCTAHFGKKHFKRFVKFRKKMNQTPPVFSN